MHSKEGLDQLSTISVSVARSDSMRECRDGIESAAQAVWEIERRVTFFTTQIMACEAFIAQLVVEGGAGST